MVEQINQMLASKAQGNPFGATVKFVANEGVFYVDGTNGSVSNEDKEAQCTIFVSSEDLQAMLSGELNPTTAFMSGKMRIEGDMSVAMKLQSIF
ncbi:MAG: SCP2 sterol-binding domain-containing protein [Microscillaceae bacterium]|nr:SCP2 sterol-binding domain-containing protein [Microscillaceae bacterium]MDW8460210.1 SCP2 sterol-binding domain-containing protein [Cytophagales bacterium]